MLPFRYRLVRTTIKFLFDILARVQAQGLEKLPENGPYIMAVNHLNLVDPGLVFAALGERDATGFVGSTHRRNPAVRLLVFLVGGIWLRRGEADSSALKAALVELDRGRIFGIAPEGTRSKTGGLIPGREGAAFLAHRAGVPIYPMALWGTEQIVAAWKRLRRPDIYIVVGEPLELSNVDVESRPQRLRIWTDEIMCHIAALLPPEYRGVYADHPRLQELLAAG